MNPIKLLYHWSQSLANIFTAWNKPQTFLLAAFSLGVTLARRCTLSRVAEALHWLGKADTVERRLQRFLANGQIDWQEGCGTLAHWVLGSLRLRRRLVVLLVDAVDLKNHLQVMVVSLAYRGRAIPLAWWCYRQDQWPMGQVKLIDTLLGWVAPAIPAGYTVLVQADRGIGTSPALLRRIEKRAWYYLVRVQSDVHLIRQDTEQEVVFGQMLQRPGQVPWSGWVQAFKKAGWLRCYALAYWGRDHKEPWLLLTNYPGAQSQWYGWRMWEELAFRDLKSSGWNWQKSQVWEPEHANRLWLVLAVAYAWTLSLGTQGAILPELREQLGRGLRQRYSVFRLGLRILSRLEELYDRLWCGCDFFFVAELST